MYNKYKNTLPVCSIVTDKSKKIIIQNNRFYLLFYPPLINDEKMDQNLLYFLYVDIIGIREIYFLLSLMQKNLLKFGAIFTAGLMVAYSVNAFAYTTIETSILNAVQTIKRSIFTSDGTTNGTVLVDINTGSKIFISSGVLNNTNANRVLWLDANGYVTTNVTLTGGSGNYSPREVGNWLHSVQVIWDWSDQANGDYSIVAGKDNTADARAATIAGGENNNIASGYATAHAVIGGGRNNSVNGEMATIWGWWYNTVYGSYSIVAGGYNNSIQSNYSIIAWGQNNVVDGIRSTIGWGTNNSISWSNVGVSTIAWGKENEIASNNWFIGWGWANRILDNGNIWSSIVWGEENIVESKYSLIGWGRRNSVNWDFLYILWGQSNVINGWAYATIWGGINNLVDNSPSSSILWWERNKIHYTDGSSILWGRHNILSNNQEAVIVGWQWNTITWSVNWYIWWGAGNMVSDTILPTSNLADQITGVSSILGGQYNNLNGDISSIVWWRDNILEWRWNFIGWGKSNKLYGAYSSILWGRLNTINNSYNYDYDEDLGWFGLNSIVWWGWNLIDGGTSNTILGGGANFIYWDWDQYIYPSSNIVWGNNTITYGWLNLNISNQSTITWDNSTILWWVLNNINGWIFNFILGTNSSIEPIDISTPNTNSYIIWSSSSVVWDESMTLWRNAHAWTTGRNLMAINLDSANAFTAYGSMSMLINAPYWVGINTNLVSPGLALEVNGQIKWSYVSPNNNPGLTQTVNLMGANSAACTMTIEAGIITATDCQ